ncbi:hypothetical protein ACH5RR_029066 [Cinchona calisaya]|uniref:Uncharacterized protein n=1 Tax=Cinchona calisaya TaxID=153742 RepID=A0ABD2YUI1_9GENT
MHWKHDGCGGSEITALLVGVQFTADNGLEELSLALELATYIAKQAISCFFHYYEQDNQRVKEPKYSVVKAYTAEDLLRHQLMFTNAYPIQNPNIDSAAPKRLENEPSTTQYAPANTKKHPTVEEKYSI